MGARGFLTSDIILVVENAALYTVQVYPKDEIRLLFPMFNT